MTMLTLTASYFFSTCLPRYTKVPDSHVLAEVTVSGRVARIARLSA